MKYCDKVIAVDENGVNYQKGFRLELTQEELAYIFHALDFAKDFEELDPMREELNEIVDKLNDIREISEKGLTNYEM